MDDTEIKLRCIEAAAKTPMVHIGGVAVAVREAASCWFDWIISDAQRETGRDTLRLPKKK